MNCNSSMRNMSSTYPGNLMPGQTLNPAMQNNQPSFSTGDWGQQIPFNPNMPTSPLSVAPGANIQPSVTDMLPGTNMQASMQPALPADAPETLTESIYTPGYLRDNIGSLMRVEFLIGNNMTDRTGVLEDVGASYIVLDALDGGSKMMCDIYSIKFVTILQSLPDRSLYGGLTQ